MKNQTDLKYLGEDYQYCLVREFLEDQEFFRDLSPIIDQNTFTEPTLRLFVGMMKDAYEVKDVAPDYKTLRRLIGDKANNEVELEIYEATLDKLRALKVNDPLGVKECALKFFRQQNIVRCAHEIIGIASSGDEDKYEQSVRILTEALNKGLHDDLGVKVFDNENETLSDDYRVAIPTGVDVLDDTLEGGIGKGELGVIVGPSGFGKTSLTTAMASYAATFKCDQNMNNGFKVLQIVFEDRVKQIQRKHFGRITGIEAKDLSKPENVEDVKEALANYEDRDMLNENLRIIRFPSGEKTADSIQRLIMKLINSGFTPDLVIVDYFECLKHIGPSSMSEWDKEGITMRKFESMAGELNIAFWIPVQGNKDSVNQEIVTMDKAGGSFKKIQIGHIVISIARSLDDIEANIATFCVLKNRAGKSGRIFSNVYMNNGTCIIDSTNADEYSTLASFDDQKDQARIKAQREIAAQMKARKDDD